MLNRFRFTALAVVLVLVGMFGWWWWKAGAAKQEPAALADALAADGWRVSLGEVSVVGAPSRLDLTILAPLLSTADGVWGWSADALTVRRVIYQPDHVLVDAPGAHRIDTPAGPAALSLRRAGASLVFGEDGYREGVLARLSAVLEEVEAVEGAALTAQRMEVHLARPPRAEPVPGLAARRLFLGARALSIGFSRPVELRVDGEGLFDRPLDRQGRGAPQLLSVDLRPGARLSWGEGDGRGELLLSGRLSRNAGEDPLTGWRGKLAFESDQAAEALNILGAWGLLDAPSRRRLEARIAESGRLAGVLEIDRAAVSVLDLGPEPILLRGGDEAR